MIKTKKDYKEYLIADLKATEIYKSKFVKRLYDNRYKFYKSLRLTEFYYNRKQNIFTKIIKRFLYIRHVRLCNKFGWTIPINVFGPGLAIVHQGTIVVSGSAKIGKNCRIHVCTNIGRAISHGKAGAPIIGDNVYIGPGVKMFGNIKIGDNTAIGANSVVNKSFEEGNCTIAGVPAKKISDNTSEGYILGNIDK